MATGKAHDPTSRPGGGLSEDHRGTRTAPGDAHFRRQADRAARFTKPNGSRTPAQGRALRKALGIVEAPASDAIQIRDAALRRLLFVSDMLATALALTVGIGLIGPADLGLAAVILPPLVAIGARAMNLHARDEMVISRTTLGEAPRLFELGALLVVTVVLAQNLVVDGPILPTDAGFVLLTFTLGAIGGRAAVRRAHTRWSAPERCLMIGENHRAESVHQKLLEDSATNAEVVAVVQPQDLPGRDELLPVLAAVIRAHDVHRVIVAGDAFDADQALEIVRDLKGLGVKISLRPPLFSVVGNAVVFDDVHGELLLGVRRFGLTRSEQRIKRAMDLVGSIGLLLVAAPLIVVITLAIKLDSRGPVLFRQVRVGRDGRRFRIFKFRTMSVDAEQRKAALRDAGQAEGGLFKLAQDPRVTRVGRLLRRTSLDELPQLLNVVAGEMSLVGPRPLVVDEDNRVVGWHRRRLHLLPGMTGVWQVLGTRRLPLEEMVALDYLYIVNWSVWNDVQVVLRTATYVLGRRGM